jgi:putative phosphoribosyl transferase
VAFCAHEEPQTKMIYANRSDAGKRLARELAGYENDHPVILALPRGGVIVAAEVALALDAPLDLVLVRKLGVPAQPELAMGAVVDGAEAYMVRNEPVLAHLNITEREFRRVCDRELQEIERRRALYLQGRPRANVKDRTVIVVDDGIATGATTLAALRAVRKRGPKKLVLAVPVAPTSTIQELSGEADDIVCLQQHEPFYAIGLYYEDFRQVSDEEVVEILAKVRAA